MRKILLAGAATAAVISAAGLYAGSANAVTLPTAQNSVRDAADNANGNLKQDVRWVCRYGYYGRRHCWWVRGWHRW